MGVNKQSMNGDVERTGRFALSFTVQASIGFCSEQPRIFPHCMFFSMLSNKIMIITHDGIHRHMMWAARLTESTSMPTVETAACLSISR
jgi:hypothetical protein